MFGRDDGRGTHWLVHANVVSDAPWRARVVAVVATAARAADRAAVLGKIVHTMQNVSFGLQSVLDALEQDRPTGARLDEYLAHLRQSADRLSATMTQLNRFLVPGGSVAASSGGRRLSRRRSRGCPPRTSRRRSSSPTIQ